ncbi:MAG: TonB-dependent receptor [Cyclobacteriaceae bacterium]|nr:TonB-dependent receptor [Cyclobacteriaceae bacterium]
MKRLYSKCVRMVLLFLWLTGATAAMAQERVVSGTVRDESGSAMPGVNVIVSGTSNGTVTDTNGKYSISVGSGARLLFSFIGFSSQEVEVGSNTVLDITLKVDVTELSEIVVTGYTTERKADIIGSVAVVNSKDLLAAPVPNLSQQLQGRASGVIASGSGTPGEGAKIRIRGFTSFGNSDPLYVIDGVPTKDASRVNPNDIESVQVLKDATSASIYGARAANGVIIVTTKQGKSGTMKVDYDGYAGPAWIPKSYYPDLINTSEYRDYLSRQYDPAATPIFSHPLFGTAGSFSVPDFYVVSNGIKAGFPAGAPQVNPSLYFLPKNDYSTFYLINKTSAGTNWFDAITRSAVTQNHQITASGGSDKSTYSVGLNYFNQDGVYKYSGYERFAVRMNTSFKPNQYFKLGENFQFIRESFQNATGGGARGEASAWAQSFRMVPYIPVNDIGGGWGGNGIGDSGNGTNPLAQLYRDKDDQRINFKVTGNVFAEVNPLKDLAIRTSFGLEYGNYFTKDYVLRTYERSENTQTASLNQSFSYSLAWTWTNTAAYTKTFGDHTVKALVGTEAIKAGIIDGVNASSFAGFDFEDPIFMSLNTAINQGVTTSPYREPYRTLFSTFGRIDYGFKDKYLFNATVRRDEGSVFGAANRVGTFPAFGVGWRLSEEGFMKGIDFISDFKLRGGWGQMGNQDRVNPLDQTATFRFNPGLSNYDITRSQSTLAVGYTAFNSSTDRAKWETVESVNVGFDASVNGGWDVNFNVFSNKTKGLLVNQPRAVLGGLLRTPQVNLGDMTNNGFEFTVIKRGKIIPGLDYDASVNFTHYKNVADNIDGNELSFISGSASRLSNVWRTQAGHPISSFYGYQLDGFFKNQADLDALTMDGKRIGSWRYKDLNGDGVINTDDQTFIGNPQPKFVMGFNLGFRYKNFDLSSFILWNYGNDLFNYTKYWTEMRVFRGGISKRVLYDGYNPATQTGTLPYLGRIDGPSADDGYSDFIRSSVSDFYLESGSYLRGKNITLGYTLNSAVASKLKLQRARIYAQAINYFTITKYSGPDPDIGIQGGDLFMGLDDSAFPNPKQIMFGLSLTF